MIPNCSTCKYRGGVFKVIDGLICLYCIAFLKTKAGYREHDDIALLDIKSIQLIIKTTSIANETT